MIHGDRRFYVCIRTCSYLHAEVTWANLVPSVLHFSAFIIIIIVYMSLAK